MIDIRQLLRPAPCPYCGRRLRIIGDHIATAHPLRPEIVDRYLDMVAGAHDDYDLIAAAEAYHRALTT